MKTRLHLVSAIIWLLAAGCFLLPLISAASSEEVTVGITTILSVVVCIACVVNAVLQFIHYFKKKREKKN